MAKMSIRSSDDFAIKLSKLGKDAIEISKKAVEAGAAPVADAIRANLENVLSGESSGDLLSSLGIAPIDVDRKGDVNTKIGFDGYDKSRLPTSEFPNGIPNELKARALESGTSTQKKRPFVRPAVNKTKETSISEMERVIDEEIKKIME